MNDEQLVKLRQLHIAAPVLLPLIKEKERLAYERLLYKFRDDGIVALQHVAECNAYSTLLEEINYQLQELENASKEHQHE